MRLAAFGSVLQLFNQCLQLPARISNNYGQSFAHPQTRFLLARRCRKARSKQRCHTCSEWRWAFGQQFRCTKWWNSLVMGRWTLQKLAAPQGGHSQVGAFPCSVAANLHNLRAPKPASIDISHSSHTHLIQAVQCRSKKQRFLNERERIRHRHRHRGRERVTKHEKESQSASARRVAECEGRHIVWES